MAAMAKAAVQTTVRLDPVKYEEARRAAASDGVPLNTWIAQAVEEKLARRSQGNARP